MITLFILLASIGRIPASQPDRAVSPDDHKAMTAELAKLRMAWPKNTDAQRLADEIKKINEEASAEAIEAKADAAKQINKTRRADDRKRISEEWGEKRKAASAERQQKINKLRAAAAIIEAGERAERLAAEAEIYARYGQLGKAENLLKTAARAIAEAVVEVKGMIAPGLNESQFRDIQARRCRSYFSHWQAIRKAAPDFVVATLAGVDRDHRAAWSKLRSQNRDVRREFGKGVGMLWAELQRAGLNEDAGRTAEYWISETKGEHVEVARAAQTRPSATR